jgi:DNA-damage-inducible protein J
LFADFAIIAATRGVFMSAVNTNIRIDHDIKEQAQEIFSSLGLDMTTAINMYLRQVIRQSGLPFAVSAEPAKKTPKPGCLKGKIWMADDFDAPLNDHSIGNVRKYVSNLSRYKHS